MMMTLAVYIIKYIYTHICKYIYYIYTYIWFSVFFVPLDHAFIVDGVFHELHHPAIGAPPCMQTPNYMYLQTNHKSHSSLLTICPYMCISFYITT